MDFCIVCDISEYLNSYFHTVILITFQSVVIFFKHCYPNPSKVHPSSIAAQIIKIADQASFCIGMSPHCSDQRLTVLVLLRCSLKLSPLSPKLLSERRPNAKWPFLCIFYLVNGPLSEKWEFKCEQNDLG